MPSQVISRELDVADSELLRSWVQSRLERGEPVVLEHVQQRRLASVVEAQEEQLGALVHCSIAYQLASIRFRRRETY